MMRSILVIAILAVLLLVAGAYAQTQYVNTQNVVATFVMQDSDSGIAAYRVTTDASTWPEWIYVQNAPKTLRVEQPVTLPISAGSAVVRGQVKDVAGNESEIYQVTVSVDAVPPTASLTVTKAGS